MGSDHLAALEQGLGIQTTKLGSGEKNLAYAMPQQRAKWFLGGIFSALTVLLVLVTVYAGLYDDERVRRTFDNKLSMEKLTEEKADSVRLQFLVQQEHVASGKQIDDAKRAMSRIMNVINAKFDDYIQAEPTNSRLSSFRTNLVNFVSSELEAFRKATDAAYAQTKSRLERMSKFQEQSLRELLTSVSDVKLGAFEDMIQEVFEAAKKAPVDLEVSIEQMEQLEKLSDQIYEEQVTSFDEALKQYQAIRQGKQWGEYSEMNTVTTALDLADQIELLLDDAQLARGRKELEQIELRFKQSVAEARAIGPDDADSRDAMGEEVQANVDTVIAIHKLASEGKVPFAMLDFEAITLDDDDDE